MHEIYFQIANHWQIWWVSDIFIDQGNAFSIDWNFGPGVGAQIMWVQLLLINDSRF